MSNSACLKGGAILFLTTLTPRAVTDGVRALLEGLDAADVEAHRGVELECLAAGRGLRAAEEHTDLLAELVDEDHRGAGGG
jgi:predicted outer membrane repeat protein